MIDMGKVAIHYGWIPLILYVGMFSGLAFKMVLLTLQDILKALLVLHTGSMSTINWDYANVRILFPLGG